MGENISNIFPDKGLLSRIDKEDLKRDNTKTNTIKMGKEFE